LNPDVELHVVPKRLERKDLDDLVVKSDVVLDCSDNFATRHAINRACVAHRKPLVSGAAIRFDAQISVFDFSKANSPCYSCLFPEDGEVEEVQCSTMGVFAPLTGIIGAMQAMEAIKLLAGVGESLNGRLQTFDAKNAEWRSVKVKKDPGCQVCGNRGCG
jgi:molybdopterin/thiamine biosynthesis adenylyltransferase